MSKKIQEIQQAIQTDQKTIAPSQTPGQARHPRPSPGQTPSPMTERTPPSTTEQAPLPMTERMPLPTTERMTGRTTGRPPAQTLLADRFPSIRTRKEIRQIITSWPALDDLFSKWPPAYQEDFLDQCSGKKGVKVLYDGIFKEIFDAERTPERLSRLLSLLLEREVVVLLSLPNDSVRLGAESSLLYTDIIVRLEDGSLCNVEVQKIGYAFPGQRCACYSADHLLRQYKRVRGEKGKMFNYRDIKQVYTIVFFEQSPKEFHAFPDYRLHRFKQRSDSGLELELLQEYILIPLDICRENMENRPIGDDLGAWLTFLSSTDPVRIGELIDGYPMFKDMYQQIYDLCLDTERVVNMYSKELAILDRNTVLYMIDEMQETMDGMQETMDGMQETIDGMQETMDEMQEEHKQTLAQKDQEISQKDRAISQQAQEIAALRAQLAALR